MESVWAQFGQRSISLGAVWALFFFSSLDPGKDRQALPGVSGPLCGHLVHYGGVFGGEN